MVCFIINFRLFLRGSSLLFVIQQKCFPRSGLLSHVHGPENNREGVFHIAWEGCALSNRETWLISESSPRLFYSHREKTLALGNMKLHMTEGQGLAATHHPRAEFLPTLRMWPPLWEGGREDLQLPPLWEGVGRTSSRGSSRSITIVRGGGGWEELLLLPPLWVGVL